MEKSSIYAWALGISSLGFLPRPFNGAVEDLLDRQNVDVAVISGGLTLVLQPLDKCINKPLKAKVRAQYETWMVNGPFTYTPSGKKRALSKEMVLRWIDRAWREIPVELITRSFKSCGISDALDGTEDDAVWDDEEEEAEDIEERIDNEFERQRSRRRRVAELSPAFKQMVFFRATPVLFRTNKSDKVMVNVGCVLFINLPLFIYILISVY